MINVSKHIRFGCVKTGMLLLFICSAIATEAQTVSRADQIKAAFIYNFTQFTEWPPQSFSSPNAPFVIGIVGRDTFSKVLEELVSGEKVSGHPIVIKHLSPDEDPRSVHILFIARSDEDEIIRSLGKRNILTVGDSHDFIREGGMIRMFIDNNKIKLQINLKAVRNTNLNISSKLLRLAEVIQ